MPCAVDVAREQVQRYRLETYARRFPRLIEVRPQPAKEFGVFLADSSWPHRGVQVLLDCRNLDGKIFPAYIEARCTREYLLHLAGVRDEAPIHVYFATDAAPLARGQALFPFEGALLFTITPRRDEVTPLPMLEDTLRSPLHWDINATLPFAFGPHLWLLSDQEPRRYEIEGQQMTVRSSAVAELFGYHPERIALRPPVPPLVDFFHHGWAMAAVLVASEHFPRTHDDALGPFVLVLDQRPVLQAVTWRILDAPHLLVQDLANEYADTCPAGYTAAFTGPDVLPGPDGDVFQITRCTCIRVEYVVIIHLEPDGGTSGSSGVDSGDDSGPSSETSESASAHSDDDPPQGATAVAEVPPQSLGRPTRMHLRYEFSRVAMWVYGYFFHALLHGSCKLTSFLLLVQSSQGAFIGPDTLQLTSDVDGCVLLLCSMQGLSALFGASLCLALIYRAAGKSLPPALCQQFSASLSGRRADRRPSRPATRPFRPCACRLPELAQEG